ncbi:MAG: hypothetical protein NTV63_00070 [Candidatus Woesearchaeota archaeon]|nr:hypothetical protein [Candidatus Woesearchaeota archaeon]
MQIKIKSLSKKGFYRLENNTEIKEVMINEDMLNPKKESIAIGFANDSSSGIIEFSVPEFEKLEKAVKDKIHLIKSLKMDTKTLYE